MKPMSRAADVSHLKRLVHRRRIYIVKVLCLMNAEVGYPHYISFLILFPFNHDVLLSFVHPSVKILHSFHLFPLSKRFETCSYRLYLLWASLWRRRRRVPTSSGAKSIAPTRTLSNANKRSCPISPKCACLLMRPAGPISTPPVLRPGSSKSSACMDREASISS
jgi:hypothetical protein